jgi:hypothetical protein
MSRDVSPRTSVLLLGAAVLLALLPAMLALLGGAPAPEAGLSPAATARDVSAAALDRLERLLHGEWAVALDAPTAAGFSLLGAPPSSRGRAQPPCVATVPPAALVLLC